ncbi:hypothetical protein KC571_04465, partial [candidate division WWE3 bacterium]|nr:hypothetical protein [candidate division WWE3 bacterium]
MRNLESLLLKLYTPHEVGTLIESIPETTLQSSSFEPDWYKHLQLYVTYPFSFCDAQGCGLAQLEEKIPEIKNLGVNAIHVLPPFKSPLVDNGFDISDFLTIRDEIGGNDAFTSFLNTAKENNLHVFLDLVLNHVSDQHEWFQKAITGDPKYREYFVYSQDKPAFVSLIENEDGKYARYLINGAEKDIYIVFPDQVGEIPHWTQQKDGYWYYHTFYPQQIDLNWENPNVFMEFSKIILHWSRLGISFRLDAIPYIGKRWEEGMTDSNERTHVIIQALRTLIEQPGNTSTFLVETNRDYDELKPYFGNQQTREADLAYNFQLTEAIWTALILDDSNFIWETLDQMKHYTDWAQWVTFLRNHDELT